MSRFTLDSPASSCSELQYLLLDDLFERLEEPDDWEGRQAIAALIGFLLEHWQPADESAVRSTAGLSIENERLHAVLDELHQVIAIKPHLHSIAAETRDAILVWINRVQRHQRARLMESKASAGDGGDDPRSAAWTTDASWW